MRMVRALWAIILLCVVPIAQAQERSHWVAGWATALMVPTNENIAADADLTDATLRQVVRITLGGRQLRVRLSNVFGNAPLTIGAASIARSANNASAKIDPASLKRLTFNGEARVVIPAGAEYWSDPVALPVEAGADLTISLYLPKAPDRQTSHPGARAHSYFAKGDQAGAADLPGAKTGTRWYLLGGIEVDAPGASAVVILGDSITDGYGVQPNTNLRWPDALMLRMRADPATRNMAVLNAGIGGNRLRLDGAGPNALARFEREVLSPPGVTHLIVIEGINDLGTLTREAPATPEQHAALVKEMIGTLQQIVTRARARGIKVIGGTIMPDGASPFYHPDAANEADRAAVNAWIRTPGNFDAVVDFDAVMRDPANPLVLRADLDSGDGLHPSMMGYQVMAEAVPLSLLSPKSKDKGRQVPPPPPAIALTFDDMPAHGQLPVGTTWPEVADGIIAALKAADAPATGFLNGALLAQAPGGEKVLDAWRAAGLPLANHGWSHANLDQLTDAQFAEEVAKNEALLASKMGSEDWRWFRYPFLAEASADPAKRARIRKLLADKGYKVATVTMDFGDWAYTAPYARCVARQDYAALAEMEKAWLAGAAANADRYRAMSRALYGRDIPYVLLMHLGALDARLMPQLLEMYRKKGFRFVTLEEASRDPYYRSEVNPALPPRPQGLEGALRAKGMEVPAGPTLPDFGKMCQ
ncbi:GDSL-type esterase/lipase family protein [Sphingomonas soli]|uniref:GDSL-type esterase/lipase family protein n=1 Tax=Sphingomonas soli TaxID=266127 RepID=UPI000A4047DD|nr:GDSL-type esterase/lipase family protein [Sphingomonas soli]